MSLAFFSLPNRTAPNRRFALFSNSKLVATEEIVLGLIYYMVVLPPSVWQSTLVFRADPSLASAHWRPPIKQSSKGPTKPKHRTNSTTEFSEQFERVTRSLHNKTRALRQITPETSTRTFGKMFVTHILCRTLPVPQNCKTHSLDLWQWDSATMATTKTCTTSWATNSWHVALGFGLEILRLQFKFPKRLSPQSPTAKFLRKFRKRLAKIGAKIWQFFSQIFVL